MENLTKLLNELAVKLGTTTEFLWEILLKQAPIDAIVGISLIVLFLILIIPYVMYIKWFSKHCNELYKEDKESIHTVFCVIILIIMFALFIANICEINNTITAIFNPEYWALKEILKYIK